MAEGRKATMSKFSRIWNCVWNPPALPTPPPISTATEADRITSVVQRQLLECAFPDATFRLSGLSKKLCKEQDIRAFLAWDKTNQFRYEGKDDKYVCVNFAFRLMGQFSTPGWADHCIGFVWTNRLHAQCFFLDVEKNFWFVEPQNDALSRYHLEGETVEFGVM